MKGFRLAVLCMCSVLAIAMSSMSFAAEQKGSLQSDPRYSHAVYFLQSMNMDVSEQTLPQKTFSKGVALYADIFMGDNKVGLMSVYDNQFTLSVSNNEKLYSYKVILGSDNSIAIEKQPDVEVKQDTSKSMAVGACQYVSNVANYYACASDDNPVGFVREISTWVGAPITWNQYTWRQNYLGQTFVCPVNSYAPYNPYRFYTCGL